jgi:hypothetical protein
MLITPHVHHGAVVTAYPAPDNSRAARLQVPESCDLDNLAVIDSNLTQGAIPASWDGPHTPSPLVTPGMDEKWVCSQVIFHTLVLEQVSAGK